MYSQKKIFFEGKMLIMHSNKVLKLIKNSAFTIAAYQESKVEEISKDCELQHSFLF